MSWVKAVCAESVWVCTGLFDFSLSFLAFFDLAKARLQHTPRRSMNDNESFISAAYGTLGEHV